MNMSKFTKNKLAYHHKNLKESLVETAFEIVDKEGLKVLTLRELSIRLNISRSAIYRHYDNKEALILDVMDKGYKQLNLVLAPILQDKTHSIAKRFEMMLGEYLNIAMEQPNLYRLLFGNKYHKEYEKSHGHKDENHLMGLHPLISLLVDAQETEGIVLENPMLQLTIIWASVHGLALFLVDGNLLIKSNKEAINEYLKNVLLKVLKGL